MIEQKTLAIIPARGGSTRLKNKNIYPINGKPLIGYTVEETLKSDVFSKIIVSTDSEGISSFVKSYPSIEIHKRPKQYANEKIGVLEAVLDIMRTMPEKYDTVTYLLPTCPFRSAEDIRKGADLLDDTVDSVISTCFYEEPIQLAMIYSEDGISYPVFDNLKFGLTNSKYIQKYIRPNGGFYMGHWDRVLEKKSFFFGRIKAVLLPRDRSVDIDTVEDVAFAEAMINQKAEDSI